MDPRTRTELEEAAGAAGFKTLSAFLVACAQERVRGARDQSKLEAIEDRIAASGEARKQLIANTVLFRELMTEAGFDLDPFGGPGAATRPDDVPPHPITPVMFPGEDGARLAGEIAQHMLGAGVYVIPFSFPVVPRGKARIRVQLSAAHSADDVRACVDAFVAAREAVAR